LENDRIDEAQAKLREAIKIDNSNQAAFYYLNLAREARATVDHRKRESAGRQSTLEVEQAWFPSNKRDSLPVPNPMVSTNLVYTSRGRQEIKSKLDRIRLNEVFYDGLPLGEVIKSLRDESRKRDPDKVGINFFINPNSDAPAVAPDPNLPAAPPADLNTVTIKVNPSLNDLRLADVLDLITRLLINRSNTPSKIMPSSSPREWLRHRRSIRGHSRWIRIRLCKAWKVWWPWITVR